MSDKTAVHEVPELGISIAVTLDAPQQSVRWLIAEHHAGSTGAMMRVEMRDSDFVATYEQLSTHRRVLADLEAVLRTVEERGQQGRAAREIFLMTSMELAFRLYRCGDLRVRVQFQAPFDGPFVQYVIEASKKDLPRWLQSVSDGVEALSPRSAVTSE